MSDEEKLKKLKEEMEIYYKTLTEAYCPYFKGQVSFNQKGFEHIEFKKRNSKRLQEDQYRRFRILKYAPHSGIGDEE